MAEVRPSITITEQSIPAPVTTVATGSVAYVILAEKGKADVFYRITNEDELVNTFGQPTDETYSRDFHICKSFLTYGNDLILTRALDSGTAKLSRIGINGNVAVLIDDTGDDVYFTQYESHTMKTGDELEFYAKSAFADGDNIQIAMSDFIPGTGETWADNPDTVDGTVKFADIFEFGLDATKSEVAIVISVDGVIKEKFIVSLATGTKNEMGENEYIADYMDLKSDIVWGFASANAYSLISSFQNINLAGGTKGSNPSTAQIETAYSKFANINDVKFDYIIDGSHSANRSYIIYQIAEKRKDCIAFVGAQYSNIFANNVPLSSAATINTNIIADRLALGYSSWACYYGNWVKKYDKYQDKNIWIPATGDVVGNKVAVNTNTNLWIPAAGSTNGVLRDVIALAYNPTDSQQNDLYKNGVNHIVNVPGKGVLVMGQKTMINKNIGVSRLHLRDLFRYLEGIVGDAAFDYLHEFNDVVTRARFVNSITPTFADVQRKRGIVDFQIVCDETNNPASVVDNYGFRCSILIKGSKPIEDMRIDFYDVPTSVGFNEVTAS